MSDLLDVPRFENEEEEANWWFENRDKVEAAFERAEREGKLRRGSGAIAAVLRRAGEVTLTLRVSEHDLAVIHDLASKEGQNDQAYAAAFLHKALEAQNEGHP